MIDQLLKEKGHLSLASLTVVELISIMDAYMQGKAFEKTLPIEAVESRKGLLSIEELLTKLDISRTTFWRMRNNGLIPEYNAGGHPKFVLEEVLKAIHHKTLKS